MPLTDEHQGLKEEFLKIGDPWSEAWEQILTAHPAYFRAYVGMARVPRQRRALSPKLQSLVMLACDASVTHLYQPGIQVHTSLALQRGATPAEIVEVLELTSVLGIHAATVGVPLLCEVLEEAKAAGNEIPTHVDQKQQEDLAEKFFKARGYHPRENWRPVMAMCPDFFTAYTEFSGAPFLNGGSLSAKDKELIYTAIDCATTHLYEPGLKLHIANAVRYGATPVEICEVFELASLMGVQTMLVAVPILNQVQQQQQQ
jgi:alkylhydroperoxidase/carboxymuconolactone decarboxylase family protein YurZ